jgi:hypothetical protein
MLLESISSMKFAIVGLVKIIVLQLDLQIIFFDLLGRLISFRFCRFLIGSKYLLLQLPCKVLDILEPIGNILTDLLQEGLPGLVFILQDEDVAVLIVSLETRIVPVFDEMMC